MTKTKYLNKLSQVSQLAEIPAGELRKLQEVEQRYAFRGNEYYHSLIDWNDPKDPIRRIVIPHQDELQRWGQLDASGEHNYAKTRGLEHKYPDTALLLTSNVCGGLCRFCFRKRLFMADNNEVNRDVSAGLEYIRNHPEINNVLLTGGDPLLLSTRHLEAIIAEIRSIDHVKIIRIGSKLPAFNPFRILDDPDLLRMLKQYSLPESRIYLMAQFNHPRELTPEAVQALTQVQEAGVAIMNQTPLIRGVNDDPVILAELLNKLSYMGIAPYYVFQCRPTEGNSAYTVPIEESYQIFSEAISNCSGLARRCRYSMSHVAGKIEVVGMTDEQIFFRYHRPADPAQNPGEIMAFPRNPDSYWLDDYLDEGLAAVANSR
ncbi:MAG: KamA family radical SAM protein [Desulfuromonadales bacterium C00003096]|nr:MAG: KamA family radical SAM protein [Desulfuromonadales bacterium C00003096]